MKTIVEILEDIQPGIDYETADNLIDGLLLSSLSIIALVAELEEEFEVSIPAIEILPENFNSAKSIAQMIERLKEDE